MPACAILALIALITGPNSTRLRLVQFMPVTRAINANCTRSHASNYTHQEAIYCLLPCIVNLLGR